jgi:hypothetical protein
MTSRERVLATFFFRRTDRAPYDLTDGRIWPSLPREIVGAARRMQHR